jgi:phosphomannomutase
MEDALFVGGNDYLFAEAGVDSIPVQGPEETKAVMKAVVTCLSPANVTRSKAALAA